MKKIYSLQPRYLERCGVEMDWFNQRIIYRWTVFPRKSQRIDF